MRARSRSNWHGIQTTNENGMKKKKPLHPAAKGAAGNKAAFLKAYIRYNGNFYKALSFVGVTRGAYYTWRKDKAFCDSVDEAKEALIDNAEEQVHKAVKTGDVETAKFVLTHIGKNRGWQKTINIQADVTVHAADIIKQVHAKRQQKENPNGKEKHSDQQDD